MHRKNFKFCTIKYNYTEREDEKYINLKKTITNFWLIHKFNICRNNEFITLFHIFFIS